MSNNWGGSRVGAGRKVIPEKYRKNGYTFQLTKSEVEFIESFSGRSRSDSLRRLIREYKILKKQVDISSDK